MGNLSTGSPASYYEYARKGNIYVALARVTACVAYSTAAGTGGPLLWNNSGPTAGGTNKGVLAVLLGISASVTTASAAATSIGITGGNNQTSAPSTTTAIDAIGNTNQTAGPAPQCNVYRKGTVATAGAFFFPTHMLETGAITTTPIRPAWVDLGGVFQAGPGGWLSVAAGATATTSVIDIGLMWAEIPL